ncbi:MAG: hypothetical protein FJ244_10475, partial [Nitrospira sp.]|nr:hypothetical protein [Nitrospira sp.]
LQGEGDCVPCLGEGCERHINSVSDCLQQLPAGRVIDAARMLLAEQHDRLHRPLPMTSGHV